MASFQFKERLQAAESWILANPNPPQSWPWTWLYKVGRTVYAMARDVLSGQLTLHAMSLVYTTLLSIVPLLALSFSVLKALGVHQRMEPFLFQFFQPLGPQGIELAERCHSTAHKDATPGSVEKPQPPQLTQMHLLPPGV